MNKLLTLLASLLLLLPLGASGEPGDAEALTFLKKHAPEILTEITKLKATAAADYRSALDDARKAAADYGKLEAAGDTAAAAAYVKMYAIDFDAIGVADDIVASKDEAEKTRLTQKLRELIAASFDQWTKVEQARVRRIEKELAGLKSDLQTALREREKVIESDTARLIGESKSHQAAKKKSP